MMGFENITVRFFAYAHHDEHGVEEVEVTESEFIELDGPINYERFTVHENGVSQIILTRENDEWLEDV